MQSTQWLHDHAAERAANLELDRLVRDLRRAFVNGLMDPDVIVSLLREQGACEPEIAEVIAPVQRTRTPFRRVTR